MTMEALKRWREIVAGPEEEIDLAEAALVIAAHEYPGLDVMACLARIDEWGRTLKRRLRPDISPADALVTLNHYVFDELGFAGNAADYYDPRNSYLNDVIERRLGIPITLSLLYIEIGRRIGLALHGVSFPGHFLARCAARDGFVVLDPYARGASLGIEDLRQRLRVMRGGAEPPRDLIQHLLAPAGKKEILARLLRNLRAIYLERRDLLRALAAADRIIEVAPRIADEYRERAGIYHDLECFRAALSDLRDYLMLKPGAEDAEAVQRRVSELQEIAGRLN